MGTEAARHEKGKEMKGSSRGRPRVHQRPCMDLRKLGSCLWLLISPGSSCPRLANCYSGCCWEEVLFTETQFLAWTAYSNPGIFFWPVIFTPVPRQSLSEIFLVLFVASWLPFLCRRWLTLGNLIKNSLHAEDFFWAWSTVELGAGAQICVCQAGLWLWWWTNVACEGFCKCFSRVWRTKIAVRLPTKFSPNCPCWSGFSSFSGKCLELLGK